MIFDTLWRLTTEVQRYIRWFDHDQPNRIRNGFGPDGLYPQERSEADLERIGLKQPDGRSSCPV